MKHGRDYRTMHPCLNLLVKYRLPMQPKMPALDVIQQLLQLKV